MSEEVKEPTVIIPRAMIGTILTNGLLGELWVHSRFLGVFSDNLLRLRHDHRTSVLSW